MALHEQKIAEARRALATETTDDGRYHRNYRLFELYRPFVSDSARYFLMECIRMAEREGNAERVVYSSAQLAIQCANVGMYNEALQVLGGIEPKTDDTEVLGSYYRAYDYVYGELSYYTRMDSLRQAYQQQKRHYGQLMLRYLPPTSEACYLYREQEAQQKGELDEAMRINDEWLRATERGSHPYAMVALYRYIEYKMRRDTVQMMHWLKESVLADIRNGVMDQGSLWELANELMQQGDIDRAYRYISYTSDCAVRYGSRQRMWQIAPLLNDIAKNYKSQSEQTTTQLWLMLAAISVLAVLLLGVLFFLHRRNRQLDVARHALHGTNVQLAALNDELKSANSQLSASNEQLGVLNSKLKDANNVKDEYIGRFLSLCAQYVDKLDNYRKMVNKKMKNKELEALFEMSRSTELKEREIEELNQNFDSVFLHLFPRFVDDFNALLLPEVQIHPKNENRLTTDLRIFALIRLGIEDSSKIAEFLHYSVNTIYNYRARIKNGAIDNRGQFERKVKEIGMP